MAPTLAGHGKGVDKNVTHAQCTRSMVDFIVGHSFGGTVICKVVEATPERIHRLVFYGGLVLRDGESVYGAAPPEQRAAMDQLVVASSDGTLMLPFDLWRDGYIGDADLEVARWAYQQLPPQPFQTFLDRVDMKKFYTLQVPRSYVIGTEDCAMPPAEAPSDDESPGPLPAGADARRPRADVVESKRIDGQHNRGQPGLR